MASMEIVFAHPRFEYPSYTDYKRLVNISGFESCFVDQMDFTKEIVYIVSPINGEYRPHRDNWRDKPHNACVIQWCLERPSGVDGLANFIKGTKGWLDDHYSDFVWLSDRWLTKQVADSRCKFVVLGSHEHLATPGSGGRDLDVAHMSYVSPRRGDLLGRLTDRGIKVADNSWGDERDRTLKRSMFMLNIHQRDWPIIEPLRFALCAAYALPMITETIRDAYPYTRQGPEHYCKQATYHDLADVVCNVVAADYVPYKAMGIRMRDAMITEFDFGRQVRVSVKELMNGPLELVIR